MEDRTIQEAFKLVPKVTFEHSSFDEGEKKLLKKKSIGNLPNTLVLEDQYVGIEIEVENVRGSMPNPEVFWGVDIDNSLRNNGLEFRSIPMKGKRILYALEEFMNKLKLSNFHFSPRTSIHIHFNVLDWTLEIVKRLFIIYLVFEKSLYKFVGKDRETNIFCLPVLSSGSLENIIANMSYSSLKFWGNKYFGFNLVAIFLFGTVEVRHLGGTDKTDTIVNWLNIWFKMIQAAKRMTTKELLDLVINLNTSSNYYGFSSMIFGEYLHLLDIKDLPKSMEEGVMCVKYGYISQEFANKLKEECSVKSPAFRCMEKMKLLVQNNSNGGAQFNIPREAVMEVVRGRAFRINQGLVDQNVWFQQNDVGRDIQFEPRDLDDIRLR